MKTSNLVRLSIEIPHELKNKFKSLSASEGKTMKEKMVEWIKGYVSR